MNQPMEKPSVANVGLPMELYLEAQALGIDVAQACEQKLRAEIQAIKAARWNEQHADFLVAYNSIVEAEGVALQEWRAF